MELEKAIEVLKEWIRIDRMTREGEEYSDYNKFCEEKCIAIDTVLKALDERYQKGYREGFIQAKYEVEMDKMQEEMKVSELKRIIKEYTESHDLCIAKDCSFFEIVEDAINIAKEIKEGNNEQI